jgi:hypothetical protein
VNLDPSRDASGEARVESSTRLPHLVPALYTITNTNTTTTTITTHA